MLFMVLNNGPIVCLLLLCSTTFDSSCSLLPEIGKEREERGVFFL